MSDETRLRGLWASDEPPARDPSFVIAAVAVIARRRLRADVAVLLSTIAAVAGLAWATAPLIEGAVAAMFADASIAIAAGTALVVVAACSAHLIWGDSIWGDPFSGDWTWPQRNG